MNLTDPRVTNRPWFAARVEKLLNDPRDASIVLLMAQCGVVAVAGVGVFFAPWPILYTGPLYFVLVASLVDRFTLMLHCTSHRQLFKGRHTLLNRIIPWLLGPFFGQTPNAYFAHHMGMHHREENLKDDLSSTMRFKRDRIDHWLRYWGRFLLFGVIELYAYFSRRGQFKLRSRLLIGEGTYWASLVLLGWWNLQATLVVFVAPLLAIRTLMMMGNWAQHAFICAEHPEDPYRASITSINTRYNRRCFNDGYHILHHVMPRCHWTEHPIEFEKALAEYGRHDAIVFDGLDYFQVWCCLMTGRWSTLAKHFVHLPEAPERDEHQVIAFLKARVLALPARELPAPLGAAVGEPS